MRLLPKNEIDKRKAEEKRQVMQEGMQIAERVDTLRETVASEEVAFAKYRHDSMKSIQEEIRIKQQERDELDADLKKKRRERERLVAPLNDEWEEAKEFERKLSEKEDLLDEKEKKVSEAESALQSREKDIVKEEKSIEIRSRNADARLAESQEILVQSKKDAEHARIEAKVQDEELVLREQRVSAKEKENFATSVLILEREQLMDEKTKDLELREAKLAAGWKILEATANTMPHE